jgi:hypothetical protein
VSPVPDFSSVQDAVAGKEITGLIVVAAFDDLAKSERAGKISLKKLRTIDGIDLFSATLPGDTRPADRQPATTILIGSGDHVMISDANERLPELLIDISRRVAEQRKR